MAPPTDTRRILGRSRRFWGIFLIVVGAVAALWGILLIAAVSIDSTFSTLECTIDSTFSGCLGSPDYRDPSVAAEQLSVGIGIVAVAAGLFATTKGIRLCARDRCK